MPLHVNIRFNFCGNRNDFATDYSNYIGEIAQNFSVKQKNYDYNQQNRSNNNLYTRHILGIFTK